MLFVTHDMEEAFRFCSELVVLDGGRVIASGPKQELFERPRTVAAARLTGCKNIVAARTGWRGADRRGCVAMRAADGLCGSRWVDPRWGAFAPDCV